MGPLSEPAHPSPGEKASPLSHHYEDGRDINSNDHALNELELIQDQQLPKGYYYSPLFLGTYIVS